MPLYLAPQAGVSESPFRRLCRSFGADVVVSEFVSAEGIRRNDRKTHGFLRFHDDERPIGIQIFGADPEAMAQAAALVEEVYEPDFLDINFGCPVKKVVSRNGGSGCLRDLDLVRDIIRAVKGAISIPTTVKIRSGWSEELRDPVQIALRCQDAGAEVLTLHARTRTQMYSGDGQLGRDRGGQGGAGHPGDRQRRRVERRGRQAHARPHGVRRDHDRPRLARGALDLPAGARRARAASRCRRIPEAGERFRIVLEHARLTLAWEDEEEKAMIEFRKHLGWYTKGLPNGKALRQELFSVKRLAEAERLLEGYLEAHEGAAV